MPRGEAVNNALAGFGILALFIGAILLAVYLAPEKECFAVTVASVGGCDRNGYCGVQYSNGMFGLEMLPTVGKAGTVWRWVKP